MAAVDAIAAAASLDAMLSAQTVWRAGRAPATAAGGESTGHAALDALLPQGGWPQRALTELLLPTLARMTRAGQTVVAIAPPYLPYAPAWEAHGVDLRHLEIVEAGMPRRLAARRGGWRAPGAPHGLRRQHRVEIRYGGSGVVHGGHQPARTRPQYRPSMAKSLPASTTIGA